MYLFHGSTLPQNPWNQLKLCHIFFAILHFGINRISNKVKTCDPYGFWQALLITQVISSSVISAFLPRPLLSRKEASTPFSLNLLRQRFTTLIPISSLSAIALLDAPSDLSRRILVQKFLNKWTIFLFCSILFSSNQKEH